MAPNRNPPPTAVFPFVALPGGTSSMDGAQASFLSAEFVRHDGSSDDVYIMRETRGYFTNVRFAAAECLSGRSGWLSPRDD